MLKTVGQFRVYGFRAVRRMFVCTAAVYGFVCTVSCVTVDER